jgi:predicted ATPase
MIESIQFKNFKALRDTTLPLAPCSIIVGPNGSGKSTVLQALKLLQKPSAVRIDQILSLGTRSLPNTIVEVRLKWGGLHGNEWGGRWTGNKAEVFSEGPQGIKPHDRETQQDSVKGIRVFSLDAERIAAMAPVRERVVLGDDGTGLAAVLDGLRDEAPEQFKAIESQIGEWLPEFDRILFDRPNQGSKSVALRTREGQYKVPAVDLSQGTLIALALLTLAYHPTPPSLIALEEPDRGVHPFLLRRIKDTLYRLSHPDSCDEKREPIQVIATTHSPYFLDLFRESPEEVVVANKIGLDVRFERLTDQPHFQDILGDATLGDAWFSGVLGGVPSGS